PLGCRALFLEQHCDRAGEAVPLGSCRLPWEWAGGNAGAGAPVTACHPRARQISVALSCAMVKVPPVSCLVFTLNEEVNLPHCLRSLTWCDDVIIIDSFSTDRTEALSRASGARFLQHRFTGFGDQRNWALEQAPPKHAWALVLDADEWVPPELVNEMAERL